MPARPMWLMPARPMSCESASMAAGGSVRSCRCHGSVGGRRSSAVGCRLSAVGSRVSGLGCRLSVAASRLSTFGIAPSMPTVADPCQTRHPRTMPVRPSVTACGTVRCGNNYGPSRGARATCPAPSTSRAGTAGSDLVPVLWDAMDPVSSTGALSYAPYGLDDTAAACDCRLFASSPGLTSRSGDPEVDDWIAHLTKMARGGR